MSSPQLRHLLPIDYCISIDHIARERARTTEALSAAGTIQEYFTIQSIDLELRRSHFQTYREGLLKVDESAFPPAEGKAEVLDILLSQREEVGNWLNLLNKNRRFYEEDFQDANLKYTQLSRTQKCQAFSTFMMQTVMSASEVVRNTKNLDKRRFRKSVTGFYAGEGTNAQGMHCCITGLWLNHLLMTTAHIVPAALESMALACLFGTADDVCSSPRNGLMMLSQVEKKFSAAQITVVPIATEDGTPQRWKTVVADKSIMDSEVYLTEVTKFQWKDIHHKELTFESENRPARRYLYFRFLINYIYWTEEGKDMNWLLKAKLPHIGDKSWLTLGPYLRKSTLKTLADYVEKDGLLHVAANLGFTDEADDAATGFNKEIGLEIQVRITRENRIAKGRADPNYSDSSDSETESLSDSKAESLSDSDSE